MLVCEECGNTKHFVRKGFVYIETMVDGQDQYFEQEWQLAYIGEDLGREYECCECESTDVEWRNNCR